MDYIVKQVFDSIVSKCGSLSIAGIGVGSMFCEVEEKIKMFPLARRNTSNEYYDTYTIPTAESEIEIQFSKDFEDGIFVTEIEISLSGDSYALERILQIKEELWIFCEDESDSMGESTIDHFPYRFAFKHDEIEYRFLGTDNYLSLTLSMSWDAEIYEIIESYDEIEPEGILELDTIGGPSSYRKGDNAFESFFSSIKLKRNVLSIAGISIGSSFDKTDSLTDKYYCEGDSSEKYVRYKIETRSLDNLFIEVCSSEDSDKVSRICVYMDTYDYAIVSRFAQLPDLDNQFFESSFYDSYSCDGTIVRLSAREDDGHYILMIVLEKDPDYVPSSRTKELDPVEIPSALEQESDGNDENIPINQIEESPTEKLQNLVGLQSVKQDISSLNNVVKIQQLRKNNGMNTMSMSYHCVFTGNPGTGKTTVARIVAEIYKDLGILKKGHLVETDRSGLVADYVGQTATKTNEIIDSALDGVLFIDEAYALISGGDNDYGKEAISTLLKRMEDNRDRLVVILAGYSKEMAQFINSNSGLQSRFNRYINFPDYNSVELLEIFKRNLERNECKATEPALDLVYSKIEEALSNKDSNFGNARFIRNLFEQIITQQANRLSQYTETEISNEMLMTIEQIDVEKAI